MLILALQVLLLVVAPEAFQADEEASAWPAAALSVGLFATTLTFARLPAVSDPISHWGEGTDAISESALADSAVADPLFGGHLGMGFALSNAGSCK